jgi:uncharacterized protein with ATP-grasp and redox domains
LVIVWQNLNFYSPDASLEQGNVLVVEVGADIGEVVIDFRRQSYQKEKVTVIMRTYFDCIPCIIRQALDAIRLINDDEKKHEQILREVLFLAGKMDLSESPPAMAQKIHRVIRQLTETDDPYKLLKRRFNEFALELFPKFQGLVSSYAKPFEAAVRLAIAGNIIDLGAKCSLGLSEAEKVIEQTMTEPFDMTDFKAFQDATDRAEDILYLADNAGEIVFDRPLLEQIGPSKITFVVKGTPVINDATIDDAEEAGITNLVEVIDKNSGIYREEILYLIKEELPGYYDYATRVKKYVDRRGTPQAKIEIVGSLSVLERYNPFDRKFHIATEAPKAHVS